MEGWEGKIRQEGQGSEEGRREGGTEDRMMVRGGLGEKRMVSG